MGALFFSKEEKCIETNQQHKAVMKFVFTNNPEKVDVADLRLLIRGSDAVEYTGFGVRKDNWEVVIFGSDGPTYEEIKKELERAVICVHRVDNPPNLFSMVHNNGEIVMYMLEEGDKWLKLTIEGMLNYMTPMQFVEAAPKLNPKKPVAIGIDGLCFVIGGTSYGDDKMTIYES